MKVLATLAFRLLTLTLRLLPWVSSPTHCTTRTQLTMKYLASMPHCSCVRPRCGCYNKLSNSVNPQSRVSFHSVESTRCEGRGSVHKQNGVHSRTTNLTLTPQTWAGGRRRKCCSGGVRPYITRRRRMKPIFGNIIIVPLTDIL